jgi:hypothetical protein
MRAAVRFYKLPSVGFFHKYTISHHNLRGIGHISGPVDYLLAQTLLNFRPDTLGVAVLPGERRFLVVDAKRGAALELLASTTQLFAQVLTLQHDHPCNPFLIKPTKAPLRKPSISLPNSKLRGAIPAAISQTTGIFW